MHHENVDERHPDEIRDAVRRRGQQRFHSVQEAARGLVVPGTDVVNEPSQEVSLEEDVWEQLVEGGDVLLDERTQLRHALDEPADRSRFGGCSYVNEKRLDGVLQWIVTVRVGTAVAVRAWRGRRL